MSTTADLVAALKKELKTAQMTYADLAQQLGMAESSVKRMLAKGDMPLSRIDAICRALALDFADLARHVADNQPLLRELTPEQERAVVADKKLLLMAICVLSQWTLEQVTTAYRLTEAEGIQYLAQLDRIGIIELRPFNRYRLKLEGEVMKQVDTQLGAVARPSRVYFVTGLPKTRSGKLLRRALQAVAERRDPGDLTTMDDPAALQQVKDLVGD